MRSIRDKFFPTRADQEDIDTWRVRLLSAILPVMTVLGVVAAAPSIILSIFAQVWSVAGIDVIALIWVVFLWRTRSLSYRWRAWSLCALLYLLGTVLLLKVGYASQIYLMAVPVMVALLLGPRPALVALAINGITLLIVGYLLDADIQVAGLELSPILKWIVITINFLIVDSLMTLSTMMLLSGLEKSLNRNQESERRYRTLTEWSPVPMAVHRGGKILYANQATVRMLGADSMQDLIGKSVLEFVHPDCRHVVVQRMKDAAERGGPSPMIEEKFVKLDGSTIDAEVQAIPIVYDDEPATQIAMGDITERKRAQSERDELERKFLQAQKMEAVGNLTGGIAHDFNNLLAVILARLEMAKAELSDRPRLLEWIDACIKATERGATLTRSMLAFSRRQPLKMVRVDVAAALHETIRLLNRTLGEAIEIKEVRAPDLWVCETDPAQLQAALLNLAVNARDAMPEGGKITISARNIHLDAEDAASDAEGSTGDYVAVSVTDTGTGMTPDVIEHAFEPFFTTKDVGKGSGLGLSMIYGYVKQSGGQVKIRSHVGAGTTITLYFPRAVRPEASNDGRVGATTGQTPRGHEEILVVEDADEIRELTVELLQNLGYRVFSACQASQAFPLLERHLGIYLLLTDIALPGGMNGVKLAERALQLRPNLKVLYMSGHSDDASIHRDRVGPSFRLMQKPFRKDELAAQVRAALDNAEDWPAAGSVDIRLS
jgi:PAS domain S-box-containing protein